MLSRLIVINGMSIKVAAYGQGLLQGWNSMLVLPGTAAD
jgi:hypothetical protein